MSAPLTTADLTRPELEELERLSYELKQAARTVRRSGPAGISEYQALRLQKHRLITQAAARVSGEAEAAHRVALPDVSEEQRARIAERVAARRRERQ